MDDKFIYLDHCATTPIDEQVLAAMLPYFTTYYGNASSISHRIGRYAAEAVELARQYVARLIGASPKEITFTSGATESINQAIKGIFANYQQIGKHIITCVTEHPAVLDVCAYLRKEGANITFLPVDNLGHIDLQLLDKSIRNDTIMIILMAANNETGVIHPIAEIGAIAKKHKVLFLCDATQAIGKVPIDVNQQHIDILALSAHKFYGPKGAGALYIKRRATPIQIGSLLHGGRQENTQRAGTLNVPGIVGLGKASQIASASFNTGEENLSELRDLLEHHLLAIPETYVNGDRTERLAHVTNICFKYVKGNDIMNRLPQLALSSGSACASGLREPSPVLLAMGVSTTDAHCSIRFSLGKANTKEDIMLAVKLITETVNKLRDESPVWQMHVAGIL
ncbi:cysteine desulfurase [Olivibacter sp. SDN3]|uniref:cysteine desulfurase family protein n=1 Tax=Olivibacter sp. SDN3 TaxID=2764720 RepID=UPI001650F03A|nr:cysteine desulfurase family protein [Olivibacter sp. SDN3]QNL49080.1 cysteine desulfurase [Olivibacter sp. SDN3]